MEVGPLLVGEEQVRFPDGVQHGWVEIQRVVGVLAVGQPGVVPLLPQEDVHSVVLRKDREDGQHASVRRREGSNKRDAQRSAEVEFPALHLFYLLCMDGRIRMITYFMTNINNIIQNKATLRPSYYLKTVISYNLEMCILHQLDFVAFSLPLAQRKFSLLGEGFTQH